jgi:uncharacterized protein (TIGR02246 family)
MAGEDVDEIRRVVQAQADAWTRGDAAGYAAGAGDDLGFTNILGMRFIGLEAFIEVHERILSGIYAGSRLELELERLTFPAPDVAVAEVAVRLLDAKGMPPGIHADADGVLRTRLLEVFAKRKGEWVMVANHNTPILI